jgi:exodeoxyribonuclease-1
MAILIRSTILLKVVNTAYALAMLNLGLYKKPMNFLFYDLETSGLKPGPHRPLQFAAILTDHNLTELKRVNWLIKLSDDVLPDPEAVILTGITPQSTAGGLSEPEFIAKLKAELLLPDTVILGYNSIRFDDEFMRYTLWRNFQDPYQWQWKDGRSRFDIFPLTQMTRALRPDGIVWPFDSFDQPTNRLEDIAKANNFIHSHAHDALSDVEATIQLAKKIKDLNPKLFDFALSLKDKKVAASYLDLESPQPVVHTSGKIPKAYSQTSVIYPLCPSPGKAGGILAYDLRYDPDEFFNMSADQLRHLTYTKRKDLTQFDEQRLPIKGIQFNKCPMLAPLSVLDSQSWDRIGLTPQQIEANLAKLKSKIFEFSQKVYAAYSAQEGQFPPKSDPDLAMYDGFISNQDQELSTVVAGAKLKDLKSTEFGFQDSRLSGLLNHYKARNFPKALSPEEAEQWQSYKKDKLKNGTSGMLSLTEYSSKLNDLKESYAKNKKVLSLIQELQDWADGISG